MRISRDAGILIGTIAGGVVVTGGVFLYRLYQYSVHLEDCLNNSLGSLFETKYILPIKLSNLDKSQIKVISNYNSFIKEFPDIQQKLFKFAKRLNEREWHELLDGHVVDYPNLQALSDLQLARLLTQQWQTRWSCGEAAPYHWKFWDDLSLSQQTSLASMSDFGCPYRYDVYRILCNLQPLPNMLDYFPRVTEHLPKVPAIGKIPCFRTEVLNPTVDTGAVATMIPIAFIRLTWPNPAGTGHPADTGHLADIGHLEGIDRRGGSGRMSRSR